MHRRKLARTGGEMISGSPTPLQTAQVVLYNYLIGIKIAAHNPSESKEFGSENAPFS
jgi:hypothetical protein